MILTSLSLLILAVICYSVSQLQQHGKLRWMSAAKPYAFWGELSHRRKYKKCNSANGERWPTSTNLTVFLTDFYHHMQFWQFNLLAIAFTFAIGFNWWLLAGLLVGVRVVHFITYKLLSR